MLLICLHNMVDVVFVRGLTQNDILILRCFMLQMVYFLLIAIDPSRLQRVFVL
jgi:hypothetical protein